MTEISDQPEISIGWVPLYAPPIEPDGSHRYPPAVDLTGVEAQRTVDAHAQGMDVGVRIEHNTLVCVGLPRDVPARYCTEIYEPQPVDGTGTVHLRRTGFTRISADLADALGDPGVAPLPRSHGGPIHDGHRAPRAARRTRSTRRSTTRAGPGDDDPPAAAAGAAAGNLVPQQSVDDISTAPAVEARELHPATVVHLADADANRPPTTVDFTPARSPASGLAADDPRRPMLALLAELIADEILNGGGKTEP